MRPSRLFDSLFAYMKASGATIVRIYAMYEPLKVFSYIGAAIFAVGLAISAAVHLLLPDRHGPRARAVADHRGGADDRRLPGAAHRAGVRHDFRQPQAARGSPVPRPLAGARTRGRRTRARGRRATAAGGDGTDAWREPADTSVIVPALNEAGAIAEVVARLRAAAPGTRSSSSTTARPTRRASARAPPAPSSCGIPTTRATARR